MLFDEGFHQVLSRSSGNTQLTGALVTVNQKIRAVRMHDFVETDRITATIDEHLEILTLVLARELPSALPPCTSTWGSPSRSSCSARPSR